MIYRLTCSFSYFVFRVLCNLELPMQLRWNFTCGPPAPILVVKVYTMTLGVAFSYLYSVNSVRK